LVQNGLYIELIGQMFQKKMSELAYPQSPEIVEIQEYPQSPEIIADNSKIQYYNSGMQENEIISITDEYSTMSVNYTVPFDDVDDFIVEIFRHNNSDNVEVVDNPNGAIVIEHVPKKKCLKRKRTKTESRFENGLAPSENSKIFKPKITVSGKRVFYHRRKKVKEEEEN
jgi:hypothetical protein